jgi:hypothetical protein
MLLDVAANPTAEAVARLPKLAALARRMEKALNQIAADAMDDAPHLAQSGARLRVIEGGAAVTDRAAGAIEAIDDARRALTTAISLLGLSQGNASVQQAHAVASMARHAAELAQDNITPGAQRHLMISVQETAVHNPAHAWAWCVSGTESGVTQSGYAPTYDGAIQAAGAMVFAMSQNREAAE